MFDEILNMVKEHFGNNQQIAGNIPADEADAIHREVAGHVNSELQKQAVLQGGIGGLLAKLSEGIQSGSPITSAIEGGLIGSLGSKFHLSPAISGAIAAALPGLLQKFTHKVNDPNDNSITTESLSKSLSVNGGSLGSLFGK